MGCKYCNDGELPSYIIWHDTELLKQEFALGICVEGDELVLTSETSFSEDLERIKINYCPMCGRKL